MADTGFEIKIALGNDAMQGNADVAAALRVAAGAVLLAPQAEGKIADANGNTVGFWRFVQHDEPLGRWAGGGPIQPEDL